MKTTYPPVKMIETYARFPIRMWTVPEGDCVAWPTPLFYRFRTVVFTNQGSAITPKWVALDRYNDDDWADHRFRPEDLTGLYDQVISSEEGFNLHLEPKVLLPPLAAGASKWQRLVHFLSELVG